jgi:hypothetical protein
VIDWPIERPRKAPGDSRIDASRQGAESPSYYRLDGELIWFLTIASGAPRISVALLERPRQSMFDEVMFV